MNVMETKKTSAPARSGLTLIWIVLPLLALAAAIAWIFVADPLGRLDNGAPPVENLTFERTILNDRGLQLLVRAGGSEPMTIAQVQVDAAYWTFTQSPPGEIARGSSVWLNIDFPWNLADTHAVTVVTNTGASFDHEIAVAVPTPTATSGQLWMQALVGIIVGVVPVAIGLMFYPALRNVDQGGMNFLLALTIGLLLYLLIDMTEEALEIAGETAALFQGRVMVVLGAFAAFLILMAVGRRHGTPTGLALATYIALGIGLHNFGEGLAIGAAFAAGSAGLGAFLVLGFAIHNITEGIGIAAPILKKTALIVDFRRAYPSGRRPGGAWHVARQSRLCAAMDGFRARHRGRSHPAGHCRGLGLYGPQQRPQLRFSLPVSGGPWRSRSGNNVHVRHGGGREDMMTAAPIFPISACDAVSRKNGAADLDA